MLKLESLFFLDLCENSILFILVCRMKLASEVLEPDSIPLILDGRNRLLFSRKDLLLHLVFKLLLEGVKFLKELDFEAFNVD